jgi:hypothetical protein
MDYQEFQKEFGTEKQCLEYLYHLRWADGFCCPRCRHNEAWRIKEFKYKCQNCGYQTTVTAGTIFHHTHIPMSLWFKAAWFISKSDNRVSTAQLQKELGLGNRRTPSAILQTFQRTLKQPQRSTNPSNNVILQGSIEVVREYNKIAGNSGYIAVAIELENTKIGRVRAALADSPEKLIGFIENCVETGSIITSSISDLNSRNPLLEKGYICKKRDATYKYACANRVLDHFKGWLSLHLNGTCSKEQLSIYLEKCCDEFNRNKVREIQVEVKMTFLELLQNAIHPQPNEMIS